MKKIVLILSCIAILSFAGCGEKNPTTPHIDPTATPTPIPATPTPTATKEIKYAKVKYEVIGSDKVNFPKQFTLKIRYKDENKDYKEALVTSIANGSYWDVYWKHEMNVEVGTGYMGLIVEVTEVLGDGYPDSNDYLRIYIEDVLVSSRSGIQSKCQTLVEF